MTPSDRYTRCLAERETALAALDRLHGRIGTVRLALAASFLVLAWSWAARGTPSPAWLLAPAALFVAVLTHHQGVQARRGRARRAVAFYRAGLDRLQGNPPEGAPTGERFIDEHHLYGADLDLFGSHSLYARLCVARTPMGEAELASWLLQPADLETIRARQASIAELRGRPDLREDLALCGEPPRLALEPGALRSWSGASDALSHRWLGVSAFTLTGAAMAAAAMWAAWGLMFPLLAVLVVQAAFNHVLRARIHAAVAGIEHAYEDLKLLALLLGRIEAEPFASPALRALRDRLASDGMSASRTLSKLATRVNFVEARRNPFLAPVLLPLMYTLQSALAAEKWRRRHGTAVASWLGALGEIEALQSLAAYSLERPEDPFPEFLDGPAGFIAEGLGHPLIPPATRVGNEVALCGGTRVLLVSGSNMSGKSTLLRSVGMNAVLAMAGAPVCARRLRLTPLRVGASIRVNDSLYAGSSRFYAEITRLRRLFEPAPPGTAHWPLLFLLDELLQGTNSTDRRIGARGVLRALLNSGAIGLVTTHDLALADGLEPPPGALRNVHFQDELRGGRLSFDFLLRDGVSTKSNGIELMRAIGLEV